MINILIINIAIFILGFLFVSLLAARELNFLEKTGLAIGAGYAFSTIIFLLASLSGLTINFPIILFLIFLAMTCLVKLMKGNLGLTIKGAKEEMASLINTKHDFAEIFLLAVVGALMLTLFYKALGFGFSAWDEFSYWGMAAKAIYSGKSAVLTSVGLLPGFEKYPLFLPIASALNNLGIDIFAANYARLITPILAMGLIFFLSGYLKRLGLNRKEILLFLILLLSSGSTFSEFASILYADLSLAYFYSIAVLLYLLNFFEKPKKEYYALSALFFAFSAWVKIEGFMLVFFTILILFVFDFFYLTRKKIERSLKKLVPFGVISFSISVFWVVFGKIVGLKKASWDTHFLKNIQEKLSGLNQILMSIYSQTILSEGWPLIWCLLIVFLAIGLIFFKKNIITKILASIIGFNIIFLISSYIFIFSYEEAIIANSFGRYIIRFLPLAVVFIAIVYKDLKSTIIKKAV